MKNPLDYLPNLENLEAHVNMAVPRRRAARVRGGHVTGSFAGGSREGLQRGRQTTIFILGVLI